VTLSFVEPKVGVDKVQWACGRLDEHELSTTRFSQTPLE
jgi:hypothetical protein